MDVIRGLSNKVSISIVMPVYNSADFVIDTLKSILKQSFYDYELIIVDDCSTDNTVEVIMDLLNNNERFFIIQNTENIGAAKSRNRGLALARGEYIIFLDSDDIFHPQMLEIAYSCAINNRADVVFFDNRILSEMEQYYSMDYRIVEPSIYNKTKGFLKMLSDRNIVSPWNKLVKKDMLDKYKIEFQDIPSANDTYYAISVFLVADVIAYLAVPLCYYNYDRVGSITRKNKTSLHFLCAFEKIVEFFEDKKINEAVQIEVLNYLIMCCVRASSKYDATFQERKKFVDNLKKCSLFFKYLYEYKTFFSTTVQMFIEYCMDTEKLQNCPFIDCVIPGVLDEILLAQKQGKKVGFWGCGVIGSKLINRMDEKGIRVDYLIDNNHDLVHKKICEYMIYPYDEVEKYIDIVLVATHKNIDEIKGIAKGKEIVDILGG